MFSLVERAFLQLQSSKPNAWFSFLGDRQAAQYKSISVSSDRERERERERDREREIQTDRQIDRLKTDRKTDRQTNKQIDISGE